MIYILNYICPNILTVWGGVNFFLFNSRGYRTQQYYKISSQIHFQYESKKDNMHIINSKFLYILLVPIAVLN